MKKTTAVIITSVLLLSGCSNQKLPDDIPINSSSRSEISDPMEASEKTDQEKIPSTEYGFNFDNDNIFLPENSLILSPEIKCGSSDTNTGIMVFIDGVRQKYSVENSAEESNLATFDLIAQTEQTLNLNVDAVLDGDLDDHAVSLATMLAPGYVSTQDAPTFGFYHSMLSTGTYSVPKEIKDVFPAEKYNTLNAENSTLTQKQIDKFKIKISSDNENSISENIYLLQGDNRIEDRYKLPNGESKIKLHFSAYTTNHIVKPQRVTFYVNP